MKPILEFFRPLGFINWLLSPGVAGIDPGTAILIAGGASLAGGLIGGSSTAKAQQQANKTNLAIAEQQARDAYNNWLVSRGVNPGLSALPGTASLVANHPELKVEWERVRALGDKRDFETWLQDHIAENPSSYIAEELSSTAVNTTLPLWATTNGQPTEQFLLNSILQRSGLSTPQTEAAYSMEQALAGAPDWEVQWWKDRAAEYGVSSVGEAMSRYFAENPNETKKSWESAVLDAYSKSSTPGVSANQSASAVDPRLASLQDQAISQAGKIYDGSLLAEEMAALDPVIKARSQAAELQFARNDELRSRIADAYAAESAGAGGVRDASTAAARSLFDAESAASSAIRDALMGRASRLYDAEVAGAGAIYDASMLGAGRLRDAQLTSADVYGSQALEAVNRVLAQNDAKRRLQGFSGGSSFDDISRARTLAPALTEGALYRTKAEESYAKMLADAEAAKARALATAGTGRATTEGSAAEEYARLLAAAGIRQSGSIGNAGIDYSKAMAAAGVNQASRLGQVLDTDAAIGRENAKLQNALDQLQITTADISRRNSSGGAAGALSSQGLQLTTNATNKAFADIDSVLARMGLFSSNNSTPPTTAAATVQPTINSGQILGSALSSLGQMGMDYWTTQSLINSMKGGTKTIDTTGGQNSYWWLDPNG